MEIEYIIFDLSEVLMEGIKNLSKSVVYALNKKGFHDPDIYQKVESNFSTAKDNSNFGLIPLFEGKTSEEDFLKIFLEGNNYPLSIKELAGIISKSFVEYEYSKKLIEKIKSQGYQIILLSDHAKEWVKEIELNSSFLHLFDSIVYSFESGYVKLNQKAFEYTLKKAGADPQKTLFIDDRKENLEIAKQTGIKNVHLFENYDNLVQKFKEFGIRGF